MRSGRRLQRGSIHPRDRQQAILQIPKDAQAALRYFRGLLRMFARKTIEPRDEFVHAWIVFHCAGAERIHAEVDRVIPCGKAREMTDHFDFADFRKPFDRVAREFRAKRGGRINCRYIERRNLHAPLARSGLLEYKTLVLVRVRTHLFDRGGGRVRVYNFRTQVRSSYTGVSRIFFSAAAKRSISTRGIVSVTQTSARFVNSG